MEYTQWEKNLKMILKTKCLNPCCNGIYSMRAYEYEWEEDVLS